MININYIGDKPTQGSELATGYDLKVARKQVILPNEVKFIDTTTKLAVPEDVICLGLPRSGICHLGLILANSVGLIDPDYRGNIKFAYWNRTNEPVTILKDERLGQVIFIKADKVNFINVDSLDETKRGDTGYGNSGRV